MVVKSLSSDALQNSPLLTDCPLSERLVGGAPVVTDAKMGLIDAEDTAIIVALSATWWNCWLHLLQDTENMCGSAFKRSGSNYRRV
jgi:hypothetical protein